MDICVRCAICKDACHQYVATGDMKYLPARRAELIREIYRKYFTKAGRVRARALRGARPRREPARRALRRRRTPARAAAAACTTARSRSTPQWIIVGGQGDPDRGRPRQRDARPARRRRDLQGRQRRDVPATSSSTASRTSRPRCARRPGDPDAEIPRGQAGRRHPLRGARRRALDPARRGHLQRGRRSLDALVLRVGQLRLLLRRPREGAPDREALHGRGGAPRREGGRHHRVRARLPRRRDVLRGVGQGEDAVQGPPHPRGDRRVHQGRPHHGRPKAIKERVTYHDPCQIGRNGGIFEQPRDIVEGDRDATSST